MMDHARHLSSPSPTSPFLFHHSERASFSKSNPLTPLLSSTAVDVSSVDDCFSSTTTPSHHGHNHSHHHHHNHQAHNHHHHNHTNHHQHHNHHQSHSPFEVVDQRSQSPLVHHHHTSHSHLISSNNNHHHHLHHHADSLTGVDDEDDDDGMHNMLSGGSSSSSSSTMPLLTESHSHHSFSRISLEEYSPLSLVEDCDNALPISPSSLACVSHHSFKSSLNGLNKIGDNLVVGVDDDARSLSPSLLSSSSAHNQHHHQHHNHHNPHHHHHQHHHHHHGSSGNNHQNLWSNSSTAISQNTSILNSHSSTSFLMNQHHQQQLNSLMQQLEPQSLDESPQPPSHGCHLIGASSNSNSANQSPAANFGGLGGLGTNSLQSPIGSQLDLDGPPMTTTTMAATTTSTTMLCRPSSEPPPSCGAESVSDLECKSLNGQQANTTSSKQQKQKYDKHQSNTGGSNNLSVQSTPTRPRRNRNRSSAANKQAIEVSNNRKRAVDEAEQEQLASKAQMQLNHHEKLQELQRRLFGPSPLVLEPEPIIYDDNSDNNNNNSSSNRSNGSGQTVAPQAGCSSADNGSSLCNSVQSIKVKQEPDSSAGGQEEHAPATECTKTGVVATRTRPSRNRRSRAQTKTGSVAGPSSAKTAQEAPKLPVATEKVEPDTTTSKSCSPNYTKLADLLANTSSSATDSKGNTNINDSSFSNNSVTLSIQGTPAAASETSTATANAIVIDKGGEKRAVQTIQVRMSPSLTVMAANANGLLQPITIQQPHQLQNDNGSSGTSSSGFAASQIFCRSQPVTIGGQAGAQLKGIVSNNNELLKGGHHNEAVMSTWTLQPAANPNGANQNSGGANSGQQQQQQQQTATIGAHQIAIQVICQDGTSLVLPVSSAAGLNAAVSLTSQHQQLQAVLANNAAIAANQRNNSNNGSQNQSSVLMSVSNIVAQQQAGANEALSSASFGAPLASNSGGHASSGLAASSPTLAALLDAGCSSNNRPGANNDTNGGQSFVSGNNLLRKLVSGGGGGAGSGTQRLQIKRADQSQLGDSVTFATLNGGSLVISGPVAPTGSNQPESAKQKNHPVVAGDGGGGCDKRAKLEDAADVQASFTLVDPQGLIIAGDLDQKSPKQPQQTTSSSATTTGAAASSSASASQPAAVVKVSSDTWKQTKMGSSTGNRQVDPTQPFRCEHCNSTFTRLGNFTRHKKIHTVPTKDGQRFKCDVCSKSFLQRCDLARHLHIHRGTEPHRCNICGKGYIRHSDLVTHQRFHNKEKPFGCPQCSKGFCQRGDLNRHLRSIHLQMKPILCPCCNRKFAKQETLLRHLNTAHRSKPGSTTNGSAIIAKLAPNFPPGQADDRQQQTTAVASSTTVVTNRLASNNDNNIQKNATVASLQAIQATLCNIPQSVDPSTTTSVSSNPLISTTTSTTTTTTGTSSSISTSEQVATKAAS